MNDRDIALVGISVFSPAGDSADEFWSGISQGGDFITDVPEDVIEPYYFEGKPNGVDRFYCKRGGFVKPLRLDALRYGIMPVTATGTDPEQLVSLMAAEQALLDADVFAKGIPLQKCSIIIGRGSIPGLLQMRAIDIIRSARQFTTLLNSVMPELTDKDLETIKTAYQTLQGRYQADIATGSMPNLIASLIANRFDMHGPAYTIDAACGSGIVAINHSIALLRSGQCDVAVAGAMHAGQTAMFWGTFDMLGALSHKQVISPFSADADGLLVGQGGGFVTLKTLRRALEDGDRIYAVIKETAVCSDGAASHVMLTSVEGQTRVLERAWKEAGMDPEKIGHIEGHGTGTVAGDRIELSTLKAFFGDNSHPRAWVGSVKSNMGHTMAAAGMMGVIKTALALYRKKIPPTLHCETPAPAVFESRFMPPQEPMDWDGEELPLVAGVNAFGFGGVNTHAILTAYEPPRDAPRMRVKPVLGETLLLSAGSGPELIEKLNKGDYTDLGGPWRIAIFDPNENRLKQAVSIVNAGEPNRGKMDIWFTNRPVISNGGKIAFMFPGFLEEWATETDSLSETLGFPLMEELIAESGAEDFVDQIVQIVYRTKWLGKAALEKLGVKADMYTGYSIGEWDAALFAGLIESDMALWAKTLSTDMESYDKFPMIYVNGAGLKQAEAWCESIPDMWITGDNGPDQVVLTGKKHAMDDLVKLLDESKLFYKVIPDRIGMHTPLAENIPLNHLKFFKGLNYHEGEVPVWSATTLDTVPTERDGYVGYLTGELTKPVYFRELIEKLYEEQNARVFIQMGLGPLAGYVEDILRGKDFGAIATSVPSGASARGGAEQMRRVMALLFIEGLQADPAFMGVKPQYRAEHSLIELPKGAPPILTEIPELTEIVSKRYGAAGPGGGLPGSSLAGKGPLAAAVDGNIRDAIAVQRELARAFEGFDGKMPVMAPARAPERSVARAQADGQTGLHDAPSKSRKGKKFEERLHLTFEDHPYLIDHSIVRQPEGWGTDGSGLPEDLNPVVPFSMTLDLFAEIAGKHAPGEKLIKICNAAAYKWINVEKPLDIDVKCEWTAQNALSVDLGGYARADCVFGDEWPEPPAEYGGDIDIGKEIVERKPASEWYRGYSFHGPQYHSLIEQDRICERGMCGQARSAAGKGSLLDIMGQQLGLFLQITQSENAISFPMKVKELNLYADMLDQRGDFETVMVIKRVTDNVAAMDSVLKRDGKLWAVAKDYVVQRFISTPAVWDVILSPQENLLADEIAPGVYFYRSNLTDSLLAILSKRYLSGAEREIWEGLENQKLRREYVVSRIALKDAVRARLAAGGGEMLYPIEFSCGKNEAGKPVLVANSPGAAAVEGLFVSIAHKGTAAAAMVSDRPVGLDLEAIEEKSEDFTGVAFTDDEVGLQKKTGDPNAAIRFWVAKEACAKMTGEGLKGNPKRYEVSTVSGDELTVGETLVRTSVIGDEYIAGWTN